MKQGMRGSLFFLYIVFLFLILSFSNFFHTDAIGQPSDDCPACQLQRTTVDTVHFVVVEPVSVFPLTFQVVPEDFSCDSYIYISRTSRGPPLNLPG